MTHYTNLRTQLTNTENAYTALESEAVLVDNGELASQLLAIQTALNDIDTWITDKEESELLSTFLAAQKALMVEYNLVVDLVAVPVGYGDNYGGTESAIRFSVSKDGVQAVKVFDSIAIDQSDI